MKPLNRILGAYQESSAVLFFKARFLLILYGVLIVSSIIITVYTAYVNMINPVLGYAINVRVVGSEIGLTLLFIVCAFLLVRGYFSLAAHMTLIVLFTTIWFIMINDRTAILARLDTVVIAVAALSSTPLFINKNKMVVLIYTAANLAALYAFMLIMGSSLGLSTHATIEYLADTTMAFIFTGVVSYYLFSINTRALEHMAQAAMNTERANKELEARNEELRKSEEKFHKLFSNSPSIISVNTAHGQIYQDVNERFCEATGYTREEVQGRSLIDIGILSPRDLDAIKSAMLSRGSVKNQEITFTTKRGETRLGSASVETIDIGDSPHIVAIVNDITETRKIERELMNIVSDERRRIGQDLHDDLGQTLTGVAFLVQTLQQELEGLPAAVKTAGKVGDLVRTAIMKVRTISRMLSPVEMESRGFITAIEEMVDNIQEVFLISCKIQYDGEVEILDATVATNLYYIAREAVNNAIKHGKADEIRIRFEIREGSLAMLITDNGSGIAPERHSGGLGLKTIEYRARIIGATAKIFEMEGGGTCVAVTLPL